MQKFMLPHPSFSQHALTRPWRRLRYFISRIIGRGLQKSQTVYRVNIGGAQFKRIVLRDSFLAASIEQAFIAFGDSKVLPGFVIRYENEIWVDYITGHIPTAADEVTADRLAGFYGAIYSRNPRLVDLTDTHWLAQVERDLNFLARVNVLETRVAEALCERVASLAPTQAWIGFDYNDPVLKNFVVVDNGLCAIDVESLVTDQLLGLGAAKALSRWMEPHRHRFVERYQRSDAPDFTPYFDFVELVQLAAYAKLMFLERKWSNIDVSRLTRFCA